MKRLYIMCGVGFSGKSTLAKKIAEEKKAILVSQDQFWFEREKEMSLDLDSDEDWEKILQISRAEAKRLLLEGNSVVFDDISLTYADRELLRALASECGAETVLVYVDTPQEIREMRRQANLKTNERHHVPDHILEWGDTQLEVPQEAEKPVLYRPDADVADWLKALP